MGPVAQLIRTAVVIQPVGRALRVVAGYPPPTPLHTTHTHSNVYTYTHMQNAWALGLAKPEDLKPEEGMASSNAPSPRGSKHEGEGGEGGRSTTPSKKKHEGGHRKHGTSNSQQPAVAGSAAGGEGARAMLRTASSQQGQVVEKKVARFHDVWGELRVRARVV